MAKALYDAHIFDIALARTELLEFKELLDANTVLAERDQVLANFATWPNLCALFGTFHGRIGVADLIKREFTIGAHFRTDLTVRRAGTDCVCSVEFEAASSRDIFEPGRKRIDTWARPFEKGFSQVVDWAWAHDTYRDNPDFIDAFGSNRPNFVSVLVIGRTSSIADATSLDRWRWRTRKVTVDGQRITLLTFDELHFHFDTELKSRL